MNVEHKWLMEIANGRKTVDCRAGPIGKYDAYISQVIQLRSVETSIRVRVEVEVLQVRHYPDLEAYFMHEGWKTTIPYASDAVEAYRECKRVLGQQALGINAIQLRLVDTYQ